MRHVLAELDAPRKAKEGGLEPVRQQRKAHLLEHVRPLQIGALVLHHRVQKARHARAGRVPLLRLQHDEDARRDALGNHLAQNVGHHVHRLRHEGARVRAVLNLQETLPARANHVRDAVGSEVRLDRLRLELSVLDGEDGSPLVVLDRGVDERVRRFASRLVVGVARGVAAGAGEGVERALRLVREREVGADGRKRAARAPGGAHLLGGVDGA
mmetsp:Transcript_22298/g.72326  ORF Transcript_22298/g.72326 Transcript_22298/m.72326 type:complete len:213 (+) Transcript_22298:2128-2766(+)